MLRATIVLTLLALGCGPTEMSTEGYDRSCEVPEDCVPVFVGDTCGCGCTTEAIHADENEAYQQEWAEYQDHCTGQIPECAPCQDVVVECIDNQCEVTGFVGE